MQLCRSIAIAWCRGIHDCYFYEIQYKLAVLFLKYYVLGVRLSGPAVLGEVANTPLTYLKSLAFINSDPK